MSAEMCADNKPKSRQVFYKLSDLSKLLDVEKHVLRYWEKEFPQIEPIKIGTKRNLYTPEHLALFKEVKHLLYDERYTLAGARLRLSKIKQDSAPSTQSDQDPGLEDSSQAENTAADSQSVDNYDEEDKFGEAVDYQDDDNEDEDDEDDEEEELDESDDDDDEADEDDVEDDEADDDDDDNDEVDEADDDGNDSDNLRTKKMATETKEVSASGPPGYNKESREATILNIMEQFESINDNSTEALDSVGLNVLVGGAPTARTSFITKTEDLGETSVLPGPAGGLKEKDKEELVKELKAIRDLLLRPCL
ncbi:MAG: MerR family transcriptional regulator [Deltaproteobacteria bacterium]|jgi:DNA-binding transcriptional MerR regulator|nr:MerR family transcriptional regulator [Deltaproteobacteria bacterium]